jgi:hypothetical protein
MMNGATLRVLCLEDSPLDAALVHNVLSRAGIDVGIARFATMSERRKRICTAQKL